MNAYMHPATAAALLAKSRELNAARRERRDTAKRQAADFDASLAQLQRLGWDEKAAREIAELKAYGVPQ